VRLNKKKEELEKVVGAGSPIYNDNKDDERKLELVKQIIKGYSQSFADEISSDKIDQVFSKLYGFEEQKEETRRLLLVQKLFKVEGIKNPKSGRFFCFVGPPGTG